MDSRSIPVLRHYAVKFSMMFRREVAIGVLAPSGTVALELVEQAIAEGSAWNNTELMPVLDDNWKDENAGRPAFCTELLDGQFTPTEAAVAFEQREMRLRACEALVAAYRNAEDSGGSVCWEDVDEAYRLALSGLGRQ